MVTANPLFDQLLGRNANSDGNADGSGSSGGNGGGASGNADANSALGDARPQSSDQSNFATGSSNSSSTQTGSLEKNLSSEPVISAEQEKPRDLGREAEVAMRDLAHTKGISGSLIPELTFAALTTGQFAQTGTSLESVLATTYKNVTGESLEQPKQPQAAAPDYLAQATAAMRGIGVSNIIQDVVHSTGHQFGKQTNGEQQRDSGVGVTVA